MNEKCNQCSRQMQPVHGQNHLACYDCNTFSFPISGPTEIYTAHCTGKATAFQCPKCYDNDLQVGILHGTQVATCKNCRGFVIDSNSFGALATTMRDQYQGPEDKPVMVDQYALSEIVNCPACFNPMHSHPYHGPGNAVINSCIACELTWLDYGELGTIIRAPGQRATGELTCEHRETQTMRDRFQFQHQKRIGLTDLLGDL